MTPRLTIVLPLKGRYLFTLRFLWHAEQARLPYRILIADGQVHPVLAEMLENSRTHFPHLDIEYHRYPDDVDFACYFAKMSDALRRVTTPYAMLADNDDFLVASGIDSAIAFLDANPDFVCSAGRVAGFAVYSGLRNPSDGVYGKLNRLYAYYHAQDVTEHHIAERLRKASLNLWMFYAVIRTEALGTICDDIKELDFSDLLIFEAFHVMRILTLGKAHFDNTAVSYVRQYGTSLNASFKKDWIHHLVRSRLTSDIHAAVERISSLAAAGDGEDKATLAEDIRGIFEKKFRQFIRAKFNSFQTLKEFARLRLPSLVQAWQNRPRYLVPFQRARMLRSLANAGMSQNDLTQFRDELALIEKVLSGPEFAGVIRRYDSLRKQRQA